MFGARFVHKAHKIWCSFLSSQDGKKHMSLRCVAITGLRVESQVGFSLTKSRLFTQEDTSSIYKRYPLQTMGTSKIPYM